ncbi:Cof-type HAD-IIB family hydrolase [Paenalkalicoccus suaedae]|uniref:Cof-type HAD-IIB family hydrolase n=1 Tax=Paenalkalicoccus suaedae TaxID=2592382 RepID=A0A859FIY9_9BACI|nr:Cof-type HAD-IIB family hydrolase [Paenalkalicoccus suaedae]QKS72908.1 Cof-type HAD-IIB family hydrolase [Paenalkalicoccus suaedae]
MDKKLFFFDIDGTLLDEEKQLPEATEVAIARLQADGHIVAIATGRAPFMFTKLQERLNISSFVSFNGSYVSHNGEAIYTRPLDYDALQELTELALEKDHPVVYLDAERMRSNVKHHSYIEESIASLKFDHPKFDAEYLHGRDIYQSLLFCVEGEEKEYNKKFDQFEFIRWHEFSTDIVPVGGSKAVGIEALAEKLQIDRKDVYVFGDGPNDVEMMQYTTNSVAMGNAVAETKEAAGFITKHVSENGIEHALKHFGFLQD